MREARKRLIIIALQAARTDEKLRVSVRHRSCKVTPVSYTHLDVYKRQLKDFTVDLGNAARLREGAPDGTVFVAESGVSAPADAAALRKTGADAVLVGEYLMRAADKKQALDALREATK